ncbi:Protein of unknown function [Gryllus bimaculatus]|nr:Protein of unknown function [Gryllus bimaculatus]
MAFEEIGRWRLSGGESVNPKRGMGRRKFIFSRNDIQEKCEYFDRKKVLWLCYSEKVFLLSELRVCRLLFQSYINAFEMLAECRVAVASNVLHDLSIKMQAKFQFESVYTVLNVVLNVVCN